MKKLSRLQHAGPQRSAAKKSLNKREALRGIGAFFSYVASGKIPFWEKFVVIGFVVAYIVSPIDLIPDVPIAGWLDDMGIVALLMAYCAHRVNVVEVRDMNDPDESKIIDVSGDDCEDSKSGDLTAAGQPPAEKREFFFTHKK